GLCAVTRPGQRGVPGAATRAGPARGLSAGPVGGPGTGPAGGPGTGPARGPGAGPAGGPGAGPAGGPGTGPAGGPGAAGAAALPAGFGVAIDPGTRQLGAATLFGGAPARVLRLSQAGRAALAELRAGPVRSAAAGRLARKLTDAGLAHPRPPELASRPDVT